MGRDDAKAQHGAAAIAMLVVPVVVGVTNHWGGRMIRVNRQFGIAMVMPMLVLAVLVVVAMLMLLCMLMGVMGLVSALSH